MYPRRAARMRPALPQARPAGSLPCTPPTWTASQNRFWERVWLNYMPYRQVLRATSVAYHRRPSSGSTSGEYSYSSKVVCCLPAVPTMFHFAEPSGAFNCENTCQLYGVSQCAYPSRLWPAILWPRPLQTIPTARGSRKMVRSCLFRCGRLFASVRSGLLYRARRRWRTRRALLIPPHCWFSSGLRQWGIRDINTAWEQTDGPNRRRCGVSAGTCARVVRKADPTSAIPPAASALMVAKSVANALSGKPSGCSEHHRAIEATM